MIADHVACGHAEGVPHLGCQFLVEEGLSDDPVLADPGARRAVGIAGDEEDRQGRPPDVHLARQFRAVHRALSVCIRFSLM
jgi:hypothetical protein